MERCSGIYQKEDKCLLLRTVWSAEIRVFVCFGCNRVPKGRLNFRLFLPTRIHLHFAFSLQVKYEIFLIFVKDNVQTVLQKP